MNYQFNYCKVMLFSIMLDFGNTIVFLPIDLMDDFNNIEMIYDERPILQLSVKLDITRESLA